MVNVSVLACSLLYSPGPDPTIGWLFLHEPNQMHSPQACPQTNAI